MAKFAILFLQKGCPNIPNESSFKKKKFINNILFNWEGQIFQKTLQSPEIDLYLLVQFYHHAIHPDLSHEIF